MAIRFEPPFQEPDGFVLLGRKLTNDVFAQSLGKSFHLDVGVETILVFAIGELLNGRRRSAHFVIPRVMRCCCSSNTVDASRERNSSVMRPSFCNKSASVIWFSVPRIHCSKVCQRALTEQPP